MSAILSKAKEILLPHRFNYFHYQAGYGYTYQASREYFNRHLKIIPKVLTDVSEISLQTTIFGHIYNNPIIIAPTAFHRLAHCDGEWGTAQGATNAESIYIYNWTLSTVSTHPRLDEHTPNAKLTKLPIVCKGILSVDDAKLALEYGADGIVISNHGGRQVDSGLSAIECLKDIVEFVNGRCEVFVDGGIRTGTDVLKCLALGAKGVLVGRPILYGLTCGGHNGVEAVLNLLKQELMYDMASCGLTRIEQINERILYKYRQ
ncbi:unnamed protein product [Rotaria sp. Silwood1]|nr:unnamed protein product [Rotaria sp. Silwood1]